MSRAKTSALPAVADVSNAGLGAGASQYVRRALSESTRRGYEREFLRFSKWCVVHDRVALPAAPSTIADYLNHLSRSEKKSVATIKRIRSAISTIHAEAAIFVGADGADAAVAPAVRRTLSGIARDPKQRRRPRRIVKDLPYADLARMIESIPTSSILGLRDRALLALGWFGAFRRSELVAFDVTDLEWSDEGVIVRVPFSKTDQEGEGEIVGIPFVDEPVCAARLVRQYVDAAELVEGPLFRRTLGARGGKPRLTSRLSSQSVRLLVKAVATRLGIPNADQLAAHSLRSGLATEMGARNVTEREIMAHGRWKSERVVRGYIRRGTVLKDNVLRKLGDARAE